jgi:hypothetical protein
MGIQTFHETLVQSVTDGPTLTAAARASCIPTASRIVLPNSYFYVGKVLRFALSGRISSAITTPGTARFDICMGSAGTTIVFDSLAILLDTVAAQTTAAWFLDVELVCRAVGATTLTTFFPSKASWQTVDILGTASTPAAPKAGFNAILPWNTAPAVGAGMDNTAASALDVFFTQTVATGSLIVHNYRVDALN